MLDFSIDQGRHWEKEEGLEDASAWMKARLEERGLAVPGAVELIRRNATGAILRALTDHGPFYMKAGPLKPIHEARVALLLSQEFPQRVPEVLEISEERGWQLMRGFGNIVGVNGPLERRCAAVATWGQCQTLSSPSIEALIASGVRDLRFTSLAQRLISAAEDEEACAVLNPENRQRIAEIVPSIPIRIERLKAFGFADSLVHGDFHFGNVAECDRSGCDGGLLVFDWSRCSISTRVFDLIWPYLDLTKGEVTDIHLEWSALASSYLTAIGATVDIEDFWKDAFPLALLYQASCYIEDRDGNDGADRRPERVVFFLRELVGFNG